MSAKAMEAEKRGMLSALLRAIDVVSVVILLIMTAILGNTIAMGVRERTSEYGMLRALGFMPKQIVLFVLGESLVIGAGHVMFGGQALPRVPGLGGVAVAAAYAPTRDGKRLLIAVPVDEESGMTINLVTNWAEELKP